MILPNLLFFHTLTREEAKKIVNFPTNVYHTLRIIKKEKLSLQWFYFFRLSLSSFTYTIGFRFSQREHPIK